MSPLPTFSSFICADCGARRSLLFADARGTLRCADCDPEAPRRREPPACEDLARVVGEARERALFGSAALS
jgi:hypothetical protein